MVFLWILPLSDHSIAILSLFASLWLRALSVSSSTITRGGEYILTLVS